MIIDIVPMGCDCGLNFLICAQEVIRLVEAHLRGKSWYIHKKVNNFC